MQKLMLGENQHKSTRTSQWAGWPLQIAVPLLCAALVFLFVQQIYQDHLSRLQRDEKRTCEQWSQTIESAIVRSVRERMARAEGLANLIVLKPHVTDADLATYASLLFVADPDIQHAAVIQGAAIKSFSAATQNQRSDAIDTWQIPQPSPAVQAKLQAGHSILDGPVEQQHGKQAFVFRVPLMLRSRMRRGLGEENSPAKHRGHVAFVVELQALAAEIHSDAAQVLQISVEQLNPDTDAAVLLLGEHISKRAPCVESPIELPGATWRIRLMPIIGWADRMPDQLVVSIASTALCVLTALVVWLFLRFHLMRSEHLSQLQSAQQLMQESQTRLQQSNIDLEQFAYVASHDLQTPLRGIAGFAQLLDEEYSDKLDETASGYISRITEGTQRMQRLIQDLLLYSQVEVQGQQLKPVNLNQVVDDILLLLEPELSERNLQVTRTDLPTIWGEASQLFQLFNNVIGNGIKYNTSHTPKITIQVANGVSQDQPASNPSVEITVKDNGIGIDPEFHEQIFDVFRRLHTEREHSGTGIGLAICKRVMQRHEGEIWVTGQPGEGSCFHMRFSVYVDGL